MVDWTVTDWTTVTVLHEAALSCGTACRPLRG